VRVLAYYRLYDITRFGDWSVLQTFYYLLCQSTNVFHDERNHSKIQYRLQYSRAFTYLFTCKFVSYAFCETSWNILYLFVCDTLCIDADTEILINPIGRSSATTFGTCSFIITYNIMIVCEAYVRQWKIVNLLHSPTASLNSFVGEINIIIT